MSRWMAGGAAATTLNLKETTEKKVKERPSKHADYIKCELEFDGLFEKISHELEDRQSSGVIPEDEILPFNLASMKAGQARHDDKFGQGAQALSPIIPSLEDVGKIHFGGSDGSASPSAELIHARREFLMQWIDKVSSIVPQTNLLCRRCQLDPTIDAKAKIPPLRVIPSEQAF
ncbi:hypothetical protein DM02DRAFT_622176 [Periconia macrospinosa]|uniref:Uncharacterized protein n=1 Tax=Periconia macrospinosa TaxID=97972 RepID=A0A2V1EAW6_9PLEO|nr:hypothetical protein DM02DRAFT_622176 [Periconia macrospinosa]